MEDNDLNSNSITIWVDQHRLPKSLSEALVALGVDYVEDLDTLFESDESLLQNVRTELTEEQYQQFLTAYTHEGDENSSWSLVENSACLKISSEEVSLSTIAMEEESKRRVVKKHNQIEDLDKRLNEAATLDLLIMLDCTGSMTNFLLTAQEHIRDFVHSIGNLYPNIQLRLGFVGYRDHCDGADRLAVLPFTTDVTAFEAIVAALESASHFKWASAQRVLYHIGDYPCHGLHYHNNLPDDYPQGDPHGLEPRPLLQQLATLRVSYYFGILTNRTERMLERFAEIMGPEFIEAAPMTSCNMIEVITAAVTTLLSTSLSSSSSVENGREEQEKEHLIVPDIKTERAVTFELHRPPDYTALISESGEKGPTLNAFPGDTHVQVKCAPYPFAKGRNKLAFYAQQLLDADKDPTLVREIILKEPLSSAKRHQSLEKFEEMVSCQRAAMSLATAFNKVRPADCVAIEFAPVRVVQFLARPGRPYFIEEDQITGEWERYSNNTGWCAPCPTPHGTPHQAVQAFSHWTHHSTGGKLMVTDCQGSYNAKYNAFLLTDPAVHSEKEILRYGCTNMGSKGCERFFKSHQCNHVCKAMNLNSAK